MKIRDRIQAKLLRWFEKHGRDLPWRRTRDPYAIWVSEIMLQQTQVETVIPYYAQFLQTFPTIKDLAKAPLEKVLKAWEGLGYYSRARNLHQAARRIVQDFHGEVPDTAESLLDLPGIGRYTAGAILSIAYNKDAPILDGNVRRVLSRLFAVSGEKPEDLWEISAALIPKGKAGSFNQALMDLGAMICTPTDPYCAICPLRHLCKATAEGDPEIYPTKKKRKEIPSVEGVTAVIRWDGKVLISQRPFRGLLGGLWEFPNWKIEEKERSRLRLRLRNHIKKELALSVKVIESIGTFQHTFTHFKLTLHVFRCEPIDGPGQGRWVLIRKLHLLPMPRIHRRIADSLEVRS